MTHIKINERTKAGKSLLNMALIMSEKYSGIIIEKEIPKRKAEYKKENKEMPFLSLSESSLNKEWLSQEDNIWDSWAEAKMNKKK